MPRQTARLSLKQKLGLNTSLTTSIRVLHLDATGLTRYLEEQAGQNPHLALGPPPMDPMIWLPRWTTAFAAQTMGQTGSHDIGAMLQAPALGLIAHVTREIDHVVTTMAEREIAFALVQALEPSGWLGRPLAAIAAEAGFGVDDAERVLKRLQTIEPTGVFARSLAECLQLQAIERDCYDPVMACVLAHLDVLAAGDMARLARFCAVPEAEVMACLRVIRSFDPKPGAQFGQDAALVREPDLAVSRGATGWVVSLNRSALPDVQITTAPTRASADAKALAAARELQRIVTNRNQTLLRVAQAILKRQERVLTQGLEVLQPMTMQEVATALDLHVSTISRTIAGVSVDAPRGTVWLRALFTAPVGGEGGVASGALRAKLLRLVRDENRAQPLSDQALAEALSSPGSPLARRTVAKYRALLEIPPAHRRKRHG
ncbi:RNA polymerase factor sigma-54 [Pseudorhodobacter sp.]|uniref:RNA polymerase factor sigma-54 n=1 Tax=Pseudorhodobacter sp. TaxID=1934400 RepID=UPI002AFEA65A|nr:RNA polymerase factor sigma-54 [Pseudorhodobacter sp.]